MYKISLLTPEMVTDLYFWDQLEPLINSVTSLTDGRATIPETLDRILTNQLNVWAVTDESTPGKITGICLTRINTYPEAKFLIVEMLAGEDFDNWINAMHDALVLIAKTNNCTGMELWGRLGWIRKLRRFGWQSKFANTQLLFEESGIDGQAE